MRTVCTRPPGRHGDQYPRDLANLLLFQHDLCASGRWVCSFANWDLFGISIFFYYPLVFFATELEAIAFFDSADTYTSSNGARPAQGEWINYLSKPLVFDKIAVADYPAFLLAN